MMFRLILPELIATIIFDYSLDYGELVSATTWRVGPEEIAPMSGKAALNEIGDAEQPE
jgi:hypothetical protein